MCQTLADIGASRIDNFADAFDALRRGYLAEFPDQSVEKAFECTSKLVLGRELESRRVFMAGIYKSVPRSRPA